MKYLFRIVYCPDTSFRYIIDEFPKLTGLFYRHKEKTDLSGGAHTRVWISQHDKTASRFFMSSPSSRDRLLQKIDSGDLMIFPSPSSVSGLTTLLNSGTISGTAAEHTRAKIGKTMQSTVRINASALCGYLFKLSDWDNTSLQEVDERNLEDFIIQYV